MAHSAPSAHIQPALLSWQHSCKVSDDPDPDLAFVKEVSEAENPICAAKKEKRHRSSRDEQQSADDSASASSGEDEMESLLNRNPAR